MTTPDVVGISSTVADIKLRYDQPAIAKLYADFQGFKLRLMRQLGTVDGEESYQAGFVILLEAIRDGRIQKADRLLAFANTVFHRQYCQTLRRRTRERVRTAEISPALSLPDQQMSPLRKSIREEHALIIQEELAKLPKMWIELLRRFYVDAQPAEEICQALQLTENQFRVTKSRAKGRLTNIIAERVNGRASLTRKPKTVAY